jgi:hypothetical protein
MTSSGPLLDKGRDIDGRVWLIAESSDDLSLFVDTPGHRGRIFSIPKREIKQVEVQCYDDLLAVRFNGAAGCRK